MLTDGIQLLGASTATNLTIASGTSLPTTDNNIGELFYLTAGATGLYVYDSTGWETVGETAGASATGLFTSAISSTGANGASLGLRSNLPTLALYNSGAGAGFRTSLLTAQTDGSLTWSFRDDDWGAGLTFLAVSRAASNAASLTFTANAVNLSGLSAGLQINGSAGTAGQVLTSNGATAPTWQAGGTSAASALTGTTLAANVTLSSLTRLGTISTQTLFTVGTFVDPHPNVTRAIKIGAGGMAVIGGIRTDSIDLTGTLSADGSVGTSGQVLTSAGGGAAYWATASAGTNTFTSTPFKSSTTSFVSTGVINSEPNIIMGTTLGGTDAKMTRFYADASGLTFDFINDAGGAGVTWLKASRTGQTATNIALTAAAITLNGAVTGTSFSGVGTALTALNASNLASGTVGTVRLGSGTANSTTYLRGDGTWASVTASATALSATGTYPGSTSVVGVYAGVASGVPVFGITNPAAAANNRYFTTEVNASGVLQYRLVNDAINGVADWMTVARSGNTATNITLTGTAITLTGAVTGTSFSGVGTNLTALNATNLASGTVGTARLGTGTASATTYLRGDGTWATPAGGGGGAATSLSGTANYGSPTARGLYAGLGLGVSNNHPAILFVNESAPLNSKFNNLYTDNSGKIGWILSSDDGTVYPDFFIVSRSGTTATNVSYITNQFTLNGLSTGFRINNVAGTSGQVLTSAGAAAAPTWANLAAVTTLSVVTANGVSGSVANATSTPAITLTLGAITPTTVSTGNITTTGTLSANGGTGTAGQVLTSNGASPAAWAAIGTATAATTLTATASVSPPANAKGIFAGTNPTSGVPFLFFNNTVAAVDNRRSQLLVNDSGNIRWELFNDVGTAVVPFFSVDRSGSTATAITLTGTTINLTGTVTTLAVSGTSTLPTITAGDTVGAALLIRGGNSATTTGGNVVIRGGSGGGSGAAAGGSVLISSGTSNTVVDATANSTTVTTAPGVGVADGGQLNLTTGVSGNGGGAGGLINIAAGNGATSGTTATAGGVIRLTPGISRFGGSAGGIDLLAANAVGGNTPGSYVSIYAGNGVGVGNGGTFTLVAGNSGNGGGVGGGAVNITAGSGITGTSSSGGGISITPGRSAGGSGAAFVNIIGAAGLSGNTDGSSVSIASGLPSGAGTGGPIAISGASSANAANSIASSITINAGGGAGGATNLTHGGAVTINTGGGSLGGSSGLLQLKAGNGNQGNTAGGAANFLAGNSSGNTDGGAVQLVAGTAGAASVPNSGGAVLITAGNVGANTAASGSTGGAITVSAGSCSSNAAFSAIGGGLNLNAGNGNLGAGGGTGGNVTVRAGTGTTTGGVIQFQTATTVTNANSVQIDNTGNVLIQRVGAGLRVKEGANSKMGVATLVAGTVTVANTSVTATSRIFLTTQSVGGTPGFVYISARVVGTSFTITSGSGADTSVVAWMIVEPA